MDDFICFMLCFLASITPSTTSSASHIQKSGKFKSSGKTALIGVDTYLGNMVNRAILARSAGRSDVAKRKMREQDDNGHEAASGIVGDCEDLAEDVGVGA